MEEWSKMDLEIFSCFFRKLQVLLVIYADNLLPTTDDARFRDRGLLGFDKISFDSFPVSHAFNLFPEKVIADSPA